jgi:hypothetical protein
MNEKYTGKDRAVFRLDESESSQLLLKMLEDDIHIRIVSLSSAEIEIVPLEKPKPLTELVPGVKTVPSKKWGFQRIKHFCFKRRCSESPSDIIGISALLIKAD